MLGHASAHVEGPPGHHRPQSPADRERLGGTTLHSVNDGIESALDQAREPPATGTSASQAAARTAGSCAAAGSTCGTGRASPRRLSQSAFGSGRMRSRVKPAQNDARDP